MGHALSIVAKADGVVGIAGAAVLAYLLAVASARFVRYRAVAAAPPPSPSDIEALSRVYIETSYTEFPFLTTKALEFGLFKTYSIPSISKLLVATGEMSDRCARRTVDTDLLMREFTEHSLLSERGQTALRRMNFLHGHYPIKNSDYVYVLTVFMVEPIKWVNRYGYRKMHPNETQAHFLYWQAVGIRMGIKDIPATLEDARRYMEDYETAHMKFTETNAKIADATVKVLLNDVPSLLHGIARQFVYALSPRPLRVAMGFPEPIYGLSTVISGALSLHGLFVRYSMFPRTKPLFRTPEKPNAQGKMCPVFMVYDKLIYKDGYTIETLGPVKFEKDATLGPLHAQNHDSIEPPMLSRAVGGTAM
ncbi:hypothetical protein HK105_206227 [Polyrhizophydium stewartii]|uniref:ER-bound oxygenase mpaB/mpaB'/Rubber oxygenase catalytic domain-containing protein n=1 Tax=Polyrhizophydium stewartii TaxID=2732419 RepID=A0ABR4N471_9FUNG|nr:hypothetical protein HK105_000729 [Polyrhizophydium stewartii]